MQQSENLFFAFLHAFSWFDLFKYFIEIMSIFGYSWSGFKFLVSIMETLYFLRAMF